MMAQLLGKEGQIAVEIYRQCVAVLLCFKPPLSLSVRFAHPRKLKSIKHDWRDESLIAFNAHTMLFFPLFIHYATLALMELWASFSAHNKLQDSVSSSHFFFFLWQM